MNYALLSQAVVVDLSEIPKIHGCLIPYFIRLFSKMTVLIAAIIQSRRLRVKFPIISSWIEKRQDNFSYCDKLPIPNSDTSDLVHPYWKQKTREFIDGPFEPLLRKWYFQSYKSCNCILKTWVGPERDYQTSAQICFRK